MPLLLAHGSYAALFAALLVGGIGAPIPEDLVLLTGGVLAQRGVTSLPVTTAVCYAGVLASDLLLFTIGRRLGEAAYRHRALRRWLTPERRGRLESLFRRYGGRVVFGARFVTGLRAPVFLLASVHGVPLRRFIVWDALALAVSAPLVVSLGYFGADALANVEERLAGARLAALAVVVLASILLVVARRRRGREGCATRPAEPGR